MPKRTDMPSDEKAHLLLDAAEDRKAVDPVLLDLRGKTLLSDFFLICTGTSDVHIRAISESVQEKADRESLPRPRVEGQSAGEWVLIDFGDVVVHVMAEEQRDRYKLEQFWTTPQPKGALPPTPDSVASGGGDDDEDQLGNFDDEDEDDHDLEDEEIVDAAFFDEADSEVPPIDEDDDEDLADVPKSGTNGSGK